MRKFTDFIGTRFRESVVPIIPKGGKLSEFTTLTADRLGKIPPLAIRERLGRRAPMATARTELLLLVRNLSAGARPALLSGTHCANRHPL